MRVRHLLASPLIALPLKKNTFVALKELIDKLKFKGWQLLENNPQTQKSPLPHVNHCIL